MKNLHLAFTPSCATPSDRFGPPAAGGPDTLHAREDLAKISIFGLFSLFYCCPAGPAKLAYAKTTTVAKNWCFLFAAHASFQETLRRQFGMIGPRLLEHLPLEELNPEMKIRCVLKIEVWRALERSGCFGFRAGELQQNSTRVCKPHLHCIHTHRHTCMELQKYVTNQRAQGSKKTCSCGFARTWLQNTTHQ